MLSMLRLGDAEGVPTPLVRPTSPVQVGRRGRLLYAEGGVRGTPDEAGMSGWVEFAIGWKRRGGDRGGVEGIEMGDVGGREGASASEVDSRGVGSATGAALGERF